MHMPPQKEVMDGGMGGVNHLWRVVQIKPTVQLICLHAPSTLGKNGIGPSITDAA